MSLEVGYSVRITFWNYGSDQACRIQFNSLKPSMWTTYFSTKNEFDSMLLDGTTYTGLSGPDQIEVTPDSVMT